MATEPIPPVEPPPPVSEAAAEPEPPAPRTVRLVSLDAFRGLTILGMLLVNNIALDTATPRQLTHAGWNQGVYFADLVFPWFLLIVGVALPYSVASHKRKGKPMWQYDLRILGRAVGLVLVGCLIDSSLARQPVFDLGVLQLIGMAFFVGALLYELPTSRRLLVAAGLLVLHWAAIRYLPVPGVGAGVFTEGKNVIVHLNQVYLEPLHLKGIISVIPTAALVLIGSALGDLMRHPKLDPGVKASRMLVAGAAMLLIGWAWSFNLPLSKPFWTASYILYTAGAGTVVLALFYLLIDVTGWRAWAFPLVVLGMNAMTAYVAPILTKVWIMQQWNWTLPDGSHLVLGTAFMHFAFDKFGRYAGGWVYTLGYILVWWLVLLVLYRKRIFLRL